MLYYKYRKKERKKYGKTYFKKGLERFNDYGMGRNIGRCF